MVSKVFICGVLPEESGKTTLARALIRYLVNSGYHVIPFKPLSGHNLWWQYDSYLMNVKLGILVSEDSIRLWRAAKKRVPLELTNPCDILLSIPDYGHYGYGEFIKMILSRDVYSMVSMGRFTLVEEGSVKRVIYYRKGFLFDEDFLERMAKEAYRLKEVESYEDFIHLHERYYERAVDSCYKELMRGAHDMMLIEGFNDSVYPWKGVEDSELVVAVAPTVSLVFDKDEFFEAVHLFGTPYTVEFHRIAELVSPMKIIRLPPLSSKELKDDDRLMKRYSNVVKEIMDLI